MSEKETSDVGFWLSMFVTTVVMAIGNWLGWWKLSWWVVTAPMWLPYAISLSIIGFVLVVILCVLLFALCGGLIAMIIEEVRR